MMKLPDKVTERWSNDPKFADELDQWVLEARTEVVVEAAEYEVVKEEEEEDLWTKSMDEWAERQRSSCQKIDPHIQLHRVFIMFAFVCLLK